VVYLYYKFYFGRPLVILIKTYLGPELVLGVSLLNFFFYGRHVHIDLAHIVIGWLEWLGYDLID
jgi:hypothetical protein